MGARSVTPMLEIRREMIDATTFLMPDPRWRFVDAAGHEHRRVGNALPTLRYVIDEWWADADGEEHSDGHYECLECDEHVTPGVKSGDAVQVPGVTRFYLDGVEITREQAQQIVSDWRGRA